MGIPSEYDDNVERRNTHPLVLPKAEAKGVISKQDIEVLKRAIGSTDNQEHKKGVKSKSILPRVKTIAKQRSVLDDTKYDPGNRPHCALNRTQFPNLITAVNAEPDMNTRKQVLSLYHRLMT